MIFLRSLVFNLVYFGISAALSLYGAVACRHDPERALQLGRLWARLCLSAARRICGIDYAVSGREYLVAGPALIASQHQSAYDTMIWLLLVPRAAYVLKRELARIPLFGPVALRAGMIAVDRSGGSRALRALMRAGDAACANGRQIVIFPEGTRARPGERLELQPGIAALASRTRLPVVPVRTDSGQCWGRRAFRKLPGIVHVQILPPLPAALGRAELMRRLGEALQPVDNLVGSGAGNFPFEAKKIS